MFALLWGIATLSRVCGEPIQEEAIKHAGAGFRVLRVDPSQIVLVWKDANGVPHRSFDKARIAVESKGLRVAYLMNAGIFEPGCVPSGLHIEDGKTLRPLNLANAPGNFFLKPNGVFWIHTPSAPPSSNGDSASASSHEVRAEIAPSETFAVMIANKSAAPTYIRYALQSGPLLLINGKRHPAFKINSPNKLRRNGIGIDDKGRVILAITDDRSDVNLYDFAGLFLKLNCQNALYLDGTISQLAKRPPSACSPAPSQPHFPPSTQNFAAILAITQ